MPFEPPPRYAFAVGTVGTDVTAAATVWTLGARLTVPTPVDECVLCERALTGDQAAWNALIERYNHRVVISLVARGLPLDRAKDIAQEAWVRLVQQQRRGNLKELVLPGLAVTQAHFLALEDARRKRPLPSANPVIADAADPAASAEERLLSNEQLERAAVALRTCHPNARRVFELVYEHPELGHAEIAGRVGLSLQRVRQIVCEVRKKLRAAIDEDNHE